MNRGLILAVGAAALFLAGCAGTTRDDAKQLAGAGVTATQALTAQDTSAQKTLDVLGKWWAVHDSLVCINPKPGLREDCIKSVDSEAVVKYHDSLIASRRTLSDVMRKRAEATKQLNDAYAALADLANYDAGQETATALKSTFASINELSAAASSLAPGAAALPAITSTFTTVTTGVLVFAADERQSALMLSASNDLHTALGALTAALKVERDKAASESLLSELAKERGALYESAIDAGLISPTEVLTPVFQAGYPDLKLANPPPEYAAIVKAAALHAARAQAADDQYQVVRSYDAALATLDELSKQHEALAKKQPLDFAAIEAEIKHLYAVMATSSVKPK